jgi:hypothetical protein
MVVLARKLEQQLALVAGQDGNQPVDAWLGHSLLPFQLLGLARFLASQPPGLVILSLMFDPTETLSSSAEPIHSNDQRSCYVALLELARACRHAGHQLRLGAASKHTIERYRPLLEQARLPIPSLHPAVCGAGCPITATPRKQDLPLVLLHWGDLKADKGRHEALALVQALLSGWQPVHPCRFVFHSYSHLPLEPQEQQQLQDAQKRLGEMVLWLPAYMPQAEMQNLLASCEVALLAYNPENYAHRSSGVLLCYAAARYAACMPATAIGYGGHWLQEEAAAWGMSWQVATPAVSRDAPLWQAAINKALTTARKAQPTWTPYAKEVFGRSFVDWVLEQLPP